MNSGAAIVLSEEKLQDKRKLQAKFIAYCTMKNVQYFTLSSRKPKQPVYAMALVASAHASGDETTYTMDKVHIANEEDFFDRSEVYQRDTKAKDAARSPTPAGATTLRCCI